MKNTFTVVLALPGKQLQTFEAKSLRFPGYDGEIGILSGRQPLLTVMNPGIIHILDVANFRFLFGTTGGFCEMLDNKATLLCGALISPEDLGKEPPSPPGKPSYHPDFSLLSEQEKHEYVVALMFRAVKTQENT